MRLFLVEGLLDRINGLKARLSTIEAQLKKNSRNSHKPPSSDAFNKYTRSLRRKSKHRSGGQPNHPGSTLKWSEQVDQIQVHRVTQCEGCGCALVSSPICDLKRAKCMTYHHSRWKLQNTRLSRNIAHRAVWSIELSSHGPRLKAMMVYLTEGQFLSSKHAQQLLREVYGCELSEGTFYHNRHDYYKRLALIEAKIKTSLTHSALTHFDETGLRVESRGQ